MRSRRMPIRAAAAAALALALSAAATAAQAEYRVHFPLEPAGWELLNRAGDQRLSLQEYVPAGESAESWTRFVSIQLFSGEAVPFPGGDAAMEECRRFLLARCPEAEWRVLRRAGADRTYEWRVEGCALEPDQHEVGRLMRGPGVWARITYSVRGRMAPPDREEWLGRLAGARLVPVPR